MKGQRLHSEPVPGHDPFLRPWPGARRSREQPSAVLEDTHCHWDVTGLGILRDRVGTLLQKRADRRLVRQFWDRANPQSKGSSRLERTAELSSKGCRGSRR